MRKIGIGMLVVILGVGGCARQVREGSAGSRGVVVVPEIPAKVIYVVRHAERDRDEGDHTGGKMMDQLTGAGWARAEALAARLKDAGVTRIVTTSAVRTQETASGVMAMQARAGRPAYVDSASILHDVKKETTPEEVVAHLAATVKDGDVVLLVYHHSEIPEFLSELTGMPVGTGGIPTVEELYTQYDNLFVLTPAGEGRFKLEREKYGAPSPAAATIPATRP